MKRIKILVVDDDTDILTFIKNFLQENEFEVYCQNHGEKVVEKIRELSIDFLIIDLKLAGMNGVEIAKEVVALFDIPIIMISGVHDDIEKIVGLESGLDDFIDKPFNPRLLLARIRSCLRRSSAKVHEKSSFLETRSIPSDLTFGPFLMDSNRCILLNEHKEQIELTNTEFRLLEFFVRHSNVVVSREDLSEELGLESTSYMMRSIDVLILRLRRKIEANPSKPKYLQTRRNRGYIFINSPDQEEQHAESV